MAIMCFWDTLELTLSTDEEGKGCIKMMYDKEDLKPGYNLIRERRFSRDVVVLPEVVVLNCSNLKFEFEVYYEGEEELKQTFILHFKENPQMKLTIGTEEKKAILGLYLIDFDDEIDDDGRYDAWV